MSRFPANSYSQAVPDSNDGALEARSEEPRRGRREALWTPEFDPRLPQSQLQYGEMRPTPDGVRPSRAPERLMIETEKKMEKKEDSPPKKTEKESQDRDKNRKTKEHKKDDQSDAKEEKHRDSKPSAESKSSSESKADSKKPRGKKK